ncbi:ABC transporter permease [Xanthomonas translucens]|uniref:ABC transporter permease n=1 Tax=Xanthomonas campestris pv. translucens TaxID=343 RepID=UPI00071E85F3|nr:ABC transporter permease [Xanthomonas translucens]QEO27732.1 FtsX-like permease family protein [Xanthomonas translucens pv. undulosa]UJB14677.1 ABC transporter permease [Xanthomonas translucens pv. undulosa]
MLHYSLMMAWRSLLRTPIATALMVLAIGLGIGASMTMLTVLHVMSRDPLPGKSRALYAPHLDPLPANYPDDQQWADPADNLTWPDAMALLRAKRATHQAAMAGAQTLLWPPRAASVPLDMSGRYATAEVFALFGIPLERGHGWSASDDQNHARVIVLSHALADTLFGARDPIGQRVALGEQRIGFQVIGVAGHWNPQPLFYADPHSKGGFGDRDDFFLPLSTAMELDMGTSNSISGWDAFSGSDQARLKDPSTSWLQFWVQLDTPQQVAAYQRFLYDYAAAQHADGRFQRPPQRARLYTLMDWLGHLRMVPDDVHLQTLLALGFLWICLVNVIALLLAKFLRRGSEIGVRRALGARRGHMLLQFGSEAVLIGLLGGALGTVIAELGLWSVRQRPDDYAKVARMDLQMLLATVALAVIAALLAGLLPAWRASRINPALQIKDI